MKNIIRVCIALFLLVIAFLLKNKKKLRSILILFPALLIYSYAMYELFSKIKGNTDLNLSDVLLTDFNLNKIFNYTTDIFYFTFLFAFFSYLTKLKPVLKFFNYFFILVSIGLCYLTKQYITDLTIVYYVVLAMSLIFTFLFLFQRNYVWVFLGILQIAFIFLVQFNVLNNKWYFIFTQFNFLTIIFLCGTLISLGITEWRMKND